MLGLICTLGGLVALGIGGAKACIEEEDARRHSGRCISGSDVRYYYDRKGAQRNCANNEEFMIHYEYSTGDVWYVVWGERGIWPKRNLSQEWRDRYYESVKDKENDFTVVNDIYAKKGRMDKKMAAIMGHFIGDSYYCYGQHYRDIKTGDFYSVRKKSVNHNGRFRNVEFYIDLNTRRFVRLTDEHIKFTEKNPVPDNLIKEAQEEWDDHIDDDLEEVIKYKDDYSYDYRYWEAYYKNQDICRSYRSFCESEMMGGCMPR